jgi:hypothetical protein
MKFDSDVHNPASRVPRGISAISIKNWGWIGAVPKAIMKAQSTATNGF